MRGVIMSVDGNKAVVLTKGGDFKQIRNKNYAVGDKVRIRANYAARIGSVAAALAVFVIGGGASYFIPASYVSVDINPSFLMTLNVYDKVINIEPLNGEAETVLKRAGIKGMNINDTVDAIISGSKQAGYINDSGADVIVSVVSGIKSPKIKDKNTADNVNFVVNPSDETELKEAKNMGVSIAKAKAIEEYTGEFGGTVFENASKLGGKTVKQIESEIAEKKKPEPAPFQTSAPQPDGGVTLQSVSQPASPAEGKSAQRQPVKASPKPTSPPAQIFTPQQMFTPAPAKDSDKDVKAPEQKAEEEKPEIKRENPKQENPKQENPKPPTATENPKKTPQPSATAQPRVDERERKPEQTDNSDKTDGARSGVTQTEQKQQNNGLSEPKHDGNPANDTAPDGQKEPEIKDDIPKESGQRQPEQKQPEQKEAAPYGSGPADNTKENAPADKQAPSSSGGKAETQTAPAGGGNTAPSDNRGAAPSNNGGAPAQPNTSGGAAPSNNGGAPADGGNGGGPR